MRYSNSSILRTSILRILAIWIYKVKGFDHYGKLTGNYYGY